MSLPLSVNWYLVFGGFVLMIVELLVGVHTGFDLVLLGLAFLAGGITGNWLGNPLLGIGVATGLSFLYVIVGRKFVKNMLVVSTHTTNIDSLMGKTAIVVQEIEKDKNGKVAVGGELWLARSGDSLAIGDKSKVESVSGVTLHVSKITNGGEKS